MTEALKLLFTGMGTVFLILILVVLVGNIIIRITNRVAPVPLTSKENPEENGSRIGSSKIAAIIAVVEGTTQGKGKVISIQKFNN